MRNRRTILHGVVAGALLAGACGNGSADTATPGSIVLERDTVSVGDDQIAVQDNCHSGARLEVIETSESVELTFSVEAEDGGECFSCTTAELDAPVGERTIIDAATGEPMSPTGDCFNESGGGESLTSPPAPVEPILLEVVPSKAQPGDEVDLFFPDETLRGGYFTLERWDGESWALTNYLVSSANGKAQVYPADDNPCCDDYGVGGPGPDTVLLPMEMSVGVWRVCTMNAASNFCGRLTI